MAWKHLSCKDFGFFLCVKERGEVERYLVLLRKSVFYLRARPKQTFAIGRLRLFPPNTMQWYKKKRKRKIASIALAITKDLELLRNRN